LGTSPYPFKHYESVFTRFYRASSLRRKFGIDKRRVHLSTLIVNGEYEPGRGARGAGGHRLWKARSC
jgi:hypothetical protein